MSHSRADLTSSSRKPNRDSLDGFLHDGFDQDYLQHYYNLSDEKFEGILFNKVIRPVKERSDYERIKTEEKFTPPQDYDKLCRDLADSYPKLISQYRIDAKSAIKFINSQSMTHYDQFHEGVADAMFDSSKAKPEPFKYSSPVETVEYAKHKINSSLLRHKVRDYRAPYMDEFNPAFHAPFYDAPIESDLFELGCSSTDIDQLTQGNYDQPDKDKEPICKDKNFNRTLKRIRACHPELI